MKKPPFGFLVAPLFVIALSFSGASSQSRPGVPPKDAWTCPTTRPIKGNFTTYSGERCIYHMPGGQSFARSSTGSPRAALGSSVATVREKSADSTSKALLTATCCTPRLQPYCTS